MAANTSKVGAINSATRARMVELLNYAGDGVWYVWGIGAGEHATGRALDLMVRNKAAGDRLYAYLWRNRARLGLQHVIWWQSITSTVVAPGVRRRMADRGSVTQNHKDHLHVLFTRAPYAPPAPKAPPANLPSDWLTRVQDALKVKRSGVWRAQHNDPTEVAAEEMRKACRGWLGHPRDDHNARRRLGTAGVRRVQARLGVSVDGDVGPKTTTALRSWLVRWQRDCLGGGIAADGSWGPATEARHAVVRAELIRRSLRKDVQGVGS